MRHFSSLRIENSKIIEKIYNYINLLNKINKLKWSTWHKEQKLLREWTINSTKTWKWDGLSMPLTKEQRIFTPIASSFKRWDLSPVRKGPDGLSGLSGRSLPTEQSLIILGISKPQQQCFRIASISSIQSVCHWSYFGTSRHEKNPSIEVPGSF